MHAFILSAVRDDYTQLERYPRLHFIMRIINVFLLVKQSRARGLTIVERELGELAPNQ